MEWVGVYLHDAHERIRSNITGDLDWTLSDTCKSNGILPLSSKLIHGKITLKLFAPTKPSPSATHLFVAFLHSKNGRDTSMHSTLAFKPEQVSARL